MRREPGRADVHAARALELVLAELEFHLFGLQINVSQQETIRFQSSIFISQQKNLSFLTSRIWPRTRAKLASCSACCMFAARATWAQAAAACSASLTFRRMASQSGQPAPRAETTAVEGAACCCCCCTIIISERTSASCAFKIGPKSVQNQSKIIRKSTEKSHQRVDLLMLCRQLKFDILLLDPPRVLRVRLESSTFSIQNRTFQVQNPNILSR